MSSTAGINLDTMDDLYVYLRGFQPVADYPVQFGVTGSRGYTDLGRVALVLGTVATFFPDALMHNGNCPDGADKLCLDTWPHVSNGQGFLHPPLFHIYGSPRAYHVRNESIVARADFLLAFKHGETPGTASTIRFAKERGIPIFEFNQDV